MTALASGAELPENVIINKVEQLHIDNHHDNHHVALQFCLNQKDRLMLFIDYPLIMIRMGSLQGIPGSTRLVEPFYQRGDRKYQLFFLKKVLEIVVVSDGIQPCSPTRVMGWLSWPS